MLVGEINGVKGFVKIMVVVFIFLDVVLWSGSLEIVLGLDEVVFIYVYEGIVVINRGECSKEIIVL